MLSILVQNLTFTLLWSYLLVC